ncbi:RNA polymerase sigma factor [Nocardioides kongjuensis]|uniref:RNA polymerase sigma factor n=1 Tax=Nocardioides kongjuensis TaxID=349522 RepID=UPI00337EB4A6
MPNHDQLEPNRPGQLGGQTAQPNARVLTGDESEELEPQTGAQLAAEHQELSQYLRRAGAIGADADDLASEAICRLWVASQKGFSANSRAACLRTIARRLYIDHVRSLARERALEQVLLAKVRTAPYPSNLTDPQDEALRIAVEVARARLPIRFQRVLICTVDAQLTLEQTAVALGLPSGGAAGVLAHRARRALAASLTDRT